jgi:four helix bundle protein
MKQDTNNPYDLEERTAVFGERVLVFCKSLQYDVVSKPLVSQITRSATSVGANCMEANGDSSKKDFRNKIFICKKEIQETKHWLRMLSVCFPDKKDIIRDLWKECHELNLIFQSIASKLTPKESLKVG